MNGLALCVSGAAGKMTKQCKKTAAMAASALASAASAVNSSIVAFAEDNAGSGNDLSGQIDSVWTSAISKLSGPLFSAGILMFVIGLIGWLFTTDKKKEMMRGVWIGGLVAVVLFASNGRMVNSIIDNIRDIANGAL